MRYTSTVPFAHALAPNVSPLTNVTEMFVPRCTQPCALEYVHTCTRLLTASYQTSITPLFHDVLLCDLSNRSCSEPAASIVVSVTNTSWSEPNCVPQKRAPPVPTSSRFEAMAYPLVAPLQLAPGAPFARLNESRIVVEPDWAWTVVISASNMFPTKARTAVPERITCLNLLMLPLSARKHTRPVSMND